MNPHTALYTVEELRHLEERAAPLSGASLMERAGRAAADFALRLTAHDDARPILIACGPGNNGGDGFVLARLLREAGRQVVVVFHGDVARLSEDARAAYSAWWQAGGREVATLPTMPAEGWALAVDALFGIGLTRDIAEPWANWIARLNALPCPRLALDIPSGLFADTGVAGSTTFRATHTLTFLTHKPGCHTADGPDCCGQLQLATLDVDAPALLPAGAHLICRGRLASALPARRANSHKGDYGTVAVLGGAHGMLGALWLAARAALLLGSGRVLAAPLDANAPAIDFATLTADPVQIFVPTITTTEEGTTFYKAVLYNADRTNFVEIDTDIEGRVAAADLKAAVDKLYGKQPVKRELPVDVTGYT
ncbi:MAG: NAD(P)H-hydrate epimerase, partial [Rhodocyclaceae bacterium]|nr:NAD(P)H-hydrate epimerase [Rhodocyclaceae bacterium]